MTGRTNPDAPGRLFPVIDIGNGWTLSLQADKAGYACSPKARLDKIEDYDRVEAHIDGPNQVRVDPSELGLPQPVARKFYTPATGLPPIGGELTWDDVEVLRACLVAAGDNPNTGVPTGAVGWPGMELFHGTSLEGAADIAENGIDIDKFHKGYFGLAFYVADVEGDASMRFADASDDEGAVLRFFANDDMKALDLRNGGDWEFWVRSGLAGRVGEDGFAELAISHGVQAVYDRSVGGLAVFDPSALLIGPVPERVIAYRNRPKPGC
jgi:catechol 2,3-dioxygenase-like lactoylglutathione lyase family enzyme